MFSLYIKYLLFLAYEKFSLNINMCYWYKIHTLDSKDSVKKKILCYIVFN